jgi:hypothetical protein
MSNQVYANNMEVSCKQAAGKSICAFPDVCMTPPQTPATPPGVPIPYPNTGMASDTSDGSTSVKISGQEVMLKNKSFFKKSVGDEAGAAPMKGVVTHKNTGKVYFTAWSMDVKFEGENVVRNMDLTTHNHGSTPNTGPMLYADRMAAANIPGCEKERERVKDACDPPEEKAKCPDIGKLDGAKEKLGVARDKAKAAAKAKGMKSKDAFKKDPGYQAALGEWNAEMDDFSDAVSNSPCQQAMRCLLSPYKPSRCCPGQTPHHLVEAGSFFDKGREGGGWEDKKGGGFEFLGRSLMGAEKYDQAAAPCICVEGENQHQASHGRMHKAQNELTAKSPASAPAFAAGLVTDECQTLATAQENAAKAINEAFKDKGGCDADCVKAQLANYHEKQCGMAPGQPIRKVMA